MGHMRDDVPGDSVFQLWRGVVGGNHQGTTGTSVSQRPGRNSLLHAPTSYSEQNRFSSNSAGNVGVAHRHLHQFSAIKLRGSQSSGIELTSP